MRPNLHSFVTELSKTAGVPKGMLEAASKMVGRGKNFRKANELAYVESRLAALKKGQEIGHDMRRASKAGRKMTMEMDKANPWSRLHEAFEDKRQGRHFLRDLEAPDSIGRTLPLP